MIFSGKEIKVSENSVVREMGAGIVILNLNTERFYELNEVGKRFWELLSDNHDYTSILNILQAEYEVSAEQLQDDITRLIGDLDEAELIVGY
ncbi:PqqD family protein [Chitinophaga sp. HK235]|uniref:PqqD family protein n=1 Tax=Chitinophaga sp. HK235 TaxID=2952571 RepID=UPI002010DA2D|nr:PqqD family protein [Chitinophaga sp. HK235]